MSQPLKTVDPTYYSDGFPLEDWSRIVPRSNYIAEIEDAIENGLNLIFIDGEEDSGRTTLAAEFVRKHIQHSISVFFNPLNKLDYKVDYYCANVVLQTHCILREEVIDADAALIGTQRYHQSLNQLRRFVKSRKDKINLILDGLESEIRENPQFIRDLFSILPLGENYFRIIVTGRRLEFIDAVPKLKREEAKEISLMGFSDSDMLSYLEITSPPTSTVKDLFKVTKGYPGRLKTLRRLMANEGYSPEDITRSTSYISWLERDCDSVDLTDEMTGLILSLLALSDRMYSISDISKICSVSTDQVESIVTSVAILECTDKSVCITSPAHKRYIANLLRKNKGKIEELLIDFHAQNQSLSSMIDLPRLLSGKKEWKKVISMVDESHLNKILDGTGSLKTLADTLDLGMQASENSNSYPDLLRYSIQGAIVHELDNYLFWESEIEARISIQDFIGAISLAESAVLLIDRLRLLALIARRQKEFTSKVDEVLVELIKEQYKSIDLSSAGNKIYDIVSDLIYAIPNLAIEIIEKSTEKVSESNINDWIIAKLSFAAIDSSIKDDDGGIDSKRVKVVEAINNPAVKKINRAISFLVGNYSAEKVLDEVNKIVDPEEKLKLLRLWLANSVSTTVNVDNVIEAALGELLKTSSETSQTIEALTELSTQLPNVKDNSSRKRLYQRFKSIENHLSDLGLAKSKYKYFVNMVHTEYIMDPDLAMFSVNRLISEVDKIGDLLIKLEAYAETFDKLCELKSDRFKKQIDFIYSRILILSKELFESTASHFKISRYFIQTISIRNPRFALQIISQMNTVWRRDRARLLTVQSYLGNNFKDIRIDALREIEEEMEGNSTREILYLEVLERYGQAKELDFRVVLQLNYFIEKISDITKGGDRISALVDAYRIINKNSEWKTKLSRKIESGIYQAWKALEADWDKLDQGFTLCYELAKLNPELSRKVFRESEAIKNSGWLDSKLVAFTYMNCVKLVIRSYHGLIGASKDTADDFRIVEDLIARIPSEIEKLRAWSEVGFLAHNSQREDILKKASDGHIFLLLHDLISKRVDVSNALDAFTIVHISNPELAIRYISRTNVDLKEEAVWNICEYYVTKRNPFDFYEPRVSKYTSTFSELSKAIDILKLMTTDNNVYYMIDHIIKAIKFNKTLVRAQASDLIGSLVDIVETKFPDPRNITHDGFKIVAESKLAIGGRNIADHNSFWHSIIERSDNVPNKSDKLFVKSILLDDIPFDRITNGPALKKRMYDDVIESLNSIPAHFEFVERVIDVSENMYSYDRKEWKKYVNKAFDLSNSLKDGAEVYASQQKIVDSMYRLEPSYAKELIKQLDKENEPGKVNRLLVKHYERLEVAEKIKNNKTLDEKEKENHRGVVRSVYMALKGLNSEVVGSKKLSDITHYLPIGNKLPLSEVLPVHLYYLSNCARTYRSANDGAVATLLRDNFKESVKASNIVQVLSQRKKGTEKSYRKFFIDEEFSTNRPIKPGSRESAFSFIKSWIQDEVEDFIIVADPYFKKEDLEILKLIRESAPSIEVDILACDDVINSDPEQQYKEYWKQISDEAPPFVNITFCITQETKERPFHDRWIITKDGGLRLGTSINSLGLKKESEISVMRPNEALKIREETLIEYISRKKKEFNNQRVYYKSFSL